MMGRHSQLLVCRGHPEPARHSLSCPLVPTPPNSKPRVPHKGSKERQTATHRCCCYSEEHGDVYLIRSKNNL
ncbi:hypothetical protein TNCV_4397571 [Trichonephila clavipes]|nr:hypothetical protein TNCV_4397571 [Trichonephila clavipes]